MKKDYPLVVVGGGAAGLAASLAAAPYRNVLLLTKGEIEDQNSSSSLAQGGIAASIGENDSPLLHAMDTLRAGCGISERNKVSILTSTAPKVIERLLSIGARFDGTKEGRILLGREAAHSRRRIVHANGDATGREIMRVLGSAVKGSSRIAVVGNVRLLEFLVSENGILEGVVIEREGKIVNIEASGCILATGGIGNLYRYTTNPSFANGEGVAVAGMAGARLDSLEFVQFHPTALNVSASPLPLLTEAIRGEGGEIVDDSGERFLFSTHKDGELAPRDVISREIYRKQSEGARVWLDVRHSIGKSFKEKFPGAYSICMQHGIDPLKNLIPITPAAHYHMGGITTDEWGKTSISNLWACGETASSGIHGANRLASNSLLEAIVFGERAGKDAAGASALKRRAGSAHSFLDANPRTIPLAEETQIRSLMWNKVGILRNEKDLTSAHDELREKYLNAQSTEEKHRYFVGALISLLALKREESRGSHYREDFPNPDAAFRHRIAIQCTSIGSNMSFEIESRAA